MQATLDIARQFSQDSTPLSLSPLGNGLINETFLVTGTGLPWVLQRINRQVFPQPQWLMDNLHLLSQHVQQKPPAQVRLNIPDILLSVAQQNHVIDAAGHYWRALQFVPNSYSKEQLTSLADAEQIGWALGHFHGLSSDLDANLLHDTLPGFHIAPDYLNAYQQALSAVNNIAADADYRFCLAYIASHQASVNVLEVAKLSGELTLRVMHGDPKVNNFLFDQHTQQIISLIDLDTVKPGLLHYDIGDCLRSCCHNSADDTFDLVIAEAILKNYLAEVRDFFTVADYQYLYAAIELIPFELGLRFFTDYLQGNRYFKVTDPQQNCQRAVQQFKLSASIRQQRAALERLITRL
ncbi:MAG: aminoglycoside phosphotransferase family protein [Methylococcaceae bacterium]|nr:aminoglycoside phosphotransferase family protein [Methylococcaceae bacterium]